jgi:nucleoside-diphosphate-sugar epimerase
LEFNIANHTATIWDDGNKSFTLTNKKDLGNAVAYVLKKPQVAVNQYIFVASIETTQNDILAALEEQSGAKWTINKTTTADQIAEATRKLTAGDFTGIFTLVRATVFGSIPALHANYAKEEKLANDVLGLQLEDVKNVIQRVINK